MVINIKSGQDWTAMARKRLANSRRLLVVDPGVAAELLGISPSTMYRWLQNGEFPGMRVGVYWRIRVKDIADAVGLTQAEILDML
jgi:excisionase family DNA binding protein